MRLRQTLLGLVLCALVALASVMPWPEPGGIQAAGSVVTSPDTGGDVGQYASLVLDASGHPVVAYYDATNGDLKVMRCNDQHCKGGDESINVPDSADDVGQYASLALDASGYPVVSYYDNTNNDLKVLHCNDLYCSGGDESVTSPDTGGDVGKYPSLVLDASGHPVVSYRDVASGYLKVLHCNDPNCSGGDESTATPDTTDWNGLWTSLALDESGNPVVSHYDSANEDLKVLHCNDPNCSGGDESLTSPDTGGTVGEHSSLALDSSGDPVVSYLDNTNGDLKVLHCNDPDCNGGDESVASPDTGDWVGHHTSLALDTSGNPVVSYYDSTNGDLKVLHCNDENCSGGDESVVSLDTAADAGQHTSLALDATGSPVVSYYDAAGGDLKVLHCNDADCAASENSITSPDTAGDVGEYASLALDVSGYPVVSYYHSGNTNLKVMHCNDPDCSGGDESITTPDFDCHGNTALALDSSGYPVVAYFDTYNDLRVMHCNDPDCDGGGESIVVVDEYGGAFSAQATSLVLDSSGNPVVTYFAGSLTVLHCNDPNCSGGDESITNPDSAGSAAGAYSSLALDASGNPVISYLRYQTPVGLRIMHCNDPNCSGGDESYATVDTAGGYTSLVLDASGNPVVSYHHGGGDDLKVLHCNDPACTGGDESVTSPDTDGQVGEYTSLALDAWGNPVVSYNDSTNGDLKVLHCNDPNCSGGDEVTVSPDTAGSVGYNTSLALDDSGNPVVSYSDWTEGDLKVLHCGGPDCAGAKPAPLVEPPTPTVTSTPTPAPAPVLAGQADQPGDTGDGGEAQNARVNGPHGLYETDGDVLYFADTGNDRVRKIEPNALTGTITRVAGGGSIPCAGQTNEVGDGCAATDAILSGPRDVFVDGSGDLYIADTEHCRVRKVSSGTITTVAGDGTCGYGGDDGAATSAQLNRPSGVYVDGSGDLYIADTENCRVRKVSGGNISTVAGTGACGYLEDNGVATSANLDRPHDVYFLGDDLVIADTDNHRIRRVDLASGVITTMAGTGTAGFGGDGGDAVDAQLNGPEALSVGESRVFVADTGNDRVRRVNALTGIITTVVGEGGLTVPVVLDGPAGVAVGSLTIANTDDHTLVAAGVNEDGDRSRGFVPVRSCSILPGISSIDWVLPAVLLGLVLVRKRLGMLFIRLRSAVAPQGA